MFDMSNILDYIFRICNTVASRLPHGKPPATALLSLAAKVPRWEEFIRPSLSMAADIIWTSLKDRLLVALDGLSLSRKLVARTVGPPQAPQVPQNHREANSGQADAAASLDSLSRPKLTTQAAKPTSLTVGDSAETVPSPAQTAAVPSRDPFAATIAVPQQIPRINSGDGNGRSRSVLDEQTEFFGSSCMDMASVLVRCTGGGR